MTSDPAKTLKKQQTFILEPNDARHLAVLCGQLDAHLRQHTVQIEKTLEALVGAPSEAQRLLRLIYAALADVDSMIIGDWGHGKNERNELAGKINVRADEVRAIIMQ